MLSTTGVSVATPLGTIPATCGGTQSVENGMVYDGILTTATNQSYSFSFGVFAQYLP